MFQLVAALVIEEWGLDDDFTVNGFKEKNGWRCCGPCQPP